MTKSGRHDADSGPGIGNRKRHLLLWPVLATIILIALWSMFAGSVTLKWNNNDDSDSSILEDLDVLEVEEREKVVRHMWDVYTRTHTHTHSIGLPKFWLEAFEGGYEQLVSDVPGVRNAAVSEIAKMSLRSLPLSLHSHSHSHSSITGSRKIEQEESTTVTST